MSQAAILGAVFVFVGPSPTDDAWRDVPVQSPSKSPDAPAPEAPVPTPDEVPSPTPDVAPPEPAPDTEAPQPTPTPAPTEVAACPCDPVDWRCWQEHADVCSSTSPTWTPTHPIAPPPTQPPPPIEPAERDEIVQERAEEVPYSPPPIAYRFDSWQRRGVLFGLSLGVSGCARDMCEEFAVGGHGGVDVGYRFGIVAPVATFSIGGGRTDVSEDLQAAGWSPAESKLRWIDASVGVLLFPVRSGRFDPYVGARIGFSRFAQDLEYTGEDSSLRGAEATLSLGRGAVRLVAGVDIFARPVFSIGPRFEFGIPFGGEMCASGDVVGFPNDSDCMKIRALTEGDDTRMALDPSDLPLFWSFALVGRFVLPPRPASPPP